ncbi:exonuclease subunit SbcD [Mollicutes bacterium LVI A0039]|nr:exonuclease subunit SbcD [Mollicutes bacterium LVI A0039]
MNILHISDLHLGKIVNGFSMIEDQEFILNQTLYIIASSEIDVLVIAGDVFDRGVAPVDAVGLWSDFLNNAAKYDIDILVINGNHDSMKRLDYTSELLKASRIEIVSKDVLFVLKTIGNTNFYMLPFLSLEQASIILGEKVSDFNQLKKLIVGQIELDRNMKNVIIDHSYIITGNNDIEEDSAIRPLALGGSEFTDGSVYHDFDLVLAGHVHRHSFIRPNIYYSGSILPYSIGERNNKNGYYIHNITSEITSTYHKFNLLHQMRSVSLHTSELDAHQYSEDYVVIKLLDEGQVVNPLEKIRTKYPSVMQIDREFRTVEINEIAANQQKSLEDSFVEFYNLNSEAEIKDESLAYFMNVANKIIEGERNETT